MAATVVISAPPTHLSSRRASSRRSSQGSRKKLNFPQRPAPFDSQILFVRRQPSQPLVCRTRNVDDFAESLSPDTAADSPSDDLAQPSHAAPPEQQPDHASQATDFQQPAADTAEFQHSDATSHGASMQQANQPAAVFAERLDVPRDDVSQAAVTESQSSLATDKSSATQSAQPLETGSYRGEALANAAADALIQPSATETEPSSLYSGAAFSKGMLDGVAFDSVTSFGVNPSVATPAAGGSEGWERLAEAAAMELSGGAALGSQAGDGAAPIAGATGQSDALTSSPVPAPVAAQGDGIQGLSAQMQQVQGQGQGQGQLQEVQAQPQEPLRVQQVLDNVLSLLGLGAASAATTPRGFAEQGDEGGDGGGGVRESQRREDLALARAKSRIKRRGKKKGDADKGDEGSVNEGGSSGSESDGWSESSTRQQWGATAEMDGRTYYQETPVFNPKPPLTPSASAPPSSSSSLSPPLSTSPLSSEAGGEERRAVERAVVEMALLQEVSRGGIEGSSLEEEWDELRQAVSQYPHLSRLYNEYARDVLLAREGQRREADGGRWGADAERIRLRKRRRGRRRARVGEEEGDEWEGMSSKARMQARLRRWRAGVVVAASQSTVVEVGTMVLLTVLPIAAGAFVYVNVQEWLKGVSPQPAAVEKEPWWMLFGPAASAAGAVFGMAGLGFAAKTAAAAPVAVAVVPQMDALWRSFGGASLVALYWRTLVFGKTFRSIEWDLEAYDAPNGSMKSITIRVPSLNAVRAKIALANGLEGPADVEQLALWIPNSGDFVEPLRLAKDLALIPDFGFVIWTRTPASLHCLPSRAAKTMPSPMGGAGAGGSTGGAGGGGAGGAAPSVGPISGGKGDGVSGDNVRVAVGAQQGFSSVQSAMPAAGSRGMQATSQPMLRGQVAANGAVAATRGGGGAEELVGLSLPIPTSMPSAPSLPPTAAPTRTVTQVMTAQVPIPSAAAPSATVQPAAAAAAQPVQGTAAPASGAAGMPSQPPAGAASVFSDSSWSDNSEWQGGQGASDADISVCMIRTIVSMSAALSRPSSPRSPASSSSSPVPTNWAPSTPPATDTTAAAPAFAPQPGTASDSEVSVDRPANGSVRALGPIQPAPSASVVDAAPSSLTPSGRSDGQGAMIRGKGELRGDRSGAGGRKGPPALVMCAGEEDELIERAAQCDPVLIVLYRALSLDPHRFMRHALYHIRKG